MKRMPLKILLATLALTLAGGTALAQKTGGNAAKVYRWVDSSGQVHYGDRIPPEYASQDRDVLNRHGVPVSREEGTVTSEEAKAKAEADRAVKEAAARRQRDRILLQTYQSVAEIEQLRDRRIELVDSQLTIQEQSLAQLRQRHAQYEKQAARYKPRNAAADAAAMPDGLEADLARSEADLKTQELNLAKKRAEREAIRSRFDSDIVRFRELGGS